MKQEKEEHKVQTYLVFSLGKERYAIELLKVREVVAYVEPTSIPYSPPHVKGVINLRGKIISVVDLREKFAMSAGVITPRSTIIIIAIGNLEVGIMVDTTNSVNELNDQQISPVPEMNISVDQKFLLGMANIAGNMATLLNLDQLFAEEKLAIEKNETDINKCA